MVDPYQLTSDILGNAVGLALPAILWAVLFLLAWDTGPFAESIGFGRLAFWLLLPGALLASFAILPFGAVSYDLIAISYAGALFPILVGILALGRVAPPLRESGGAYLAFIAVLSVVLLVLVLPVALPAANALAGGLGAGLSPIALLLPAAVVISLFTVVLVSRTPRASPSATAGAGNDEVFASRGPQAPPSAMAGAGKDGVSVGRAIALLAPLTSAVVLATYAASSAIPGVGIVEAFPYYLFPPAIAGVVAVLVASAVFPGREAAAVPLAFLAGTFGVLLGADLLRQPPLYGTGPAGIYTIGGAGVFDLVYLSGLLAFVCAYATHRALGRSLAPLGEVTPPPEPTPYGHLSRAFQAGVDGRLGPALEESARAGRSAADEARRLLGLPEPPPDRPWQGLPVPGWVVSDQANLDAVARTGTTDGREGFRAWLTARVLVGLGRDLGRPRFGATSARIWGFLLDMTLLAVPAVAVWVAIVLLTPGGLSGILSSLAFSAAVYGFVALSYLYLVLAETLTGTSPGKRAVGLVVRDRGLKPVGFLRALVRNAMALPVLTVLGLGGALAVAFLLKFGTFATITVDGVALSGGLVAVGGVLVFLVGGVGLLGACGVLVIALSSERQRLGDLIAGTWVVRATPPGTAAPSPVATAPARSESGPSG